MRAPSLRDLRRNAGGRRNLTAADGIHPNDDGYAAWAHHVVDFLAPALALCEAEVRLPWGSSCMSSCKSYLGRGSLSSTTASFGSSMWHFYVTCGVLMWLLLLLIVLNRMM